MWQAPFSNLSNAAILIVDDRPDSMAVLQHTLRTAGYGRICAIADAVQAAAALVEFRPDLVLFNLDARTTDGFELLTRLSGVLEGDLWAPLVVLTADLSIERRKLAVSLGALDFLRLPPDPLELEVRVRNLVEQRFLRLQKDLKSPPSAPDVAPTEIDLLKRLALVAEFRDDETGLHTLRIGAWSAAISEILGYSRDETEILRLAAPLHDIGKIGIPDRVLLKEGPLTPAERNIMQSHTTIGAEILKRSGSPVVQLARQIALCHHERWDGLGYPIGLKGERVPQAARIVAVVDTFDALTQKRPYKPAWTKDAVLNELRSQSGRQFDPEIVLILVTLVESNGIQDIDNQLRQIA